MVGYSKTSMQNISILLEDVCDNFVDSRSIITASFYKIIMDFDITKGISREVFFALFSLASLNEKNNYKYSDKGCAYTFENSIIHKMNRALYGQVSTKLRLQKESEMPEWMIVSLEKIGNSEFFGAVAVMMIEFDKDLQDMLPDFDKMKYLVKNTPLFEGEGFIGFKEIEYACDSYTT